MEMTLTSEGMHCCSPVKKFLRYCIWKSDYTTASFVCSNKNEDSKNHVIVVAKVGLLIQNCEWFFFSWLNATLWELAIRHY